MRVTPPDWVGVVGWGRVGEGGGPPWGGAGRGRVGWGGVRGGGGEGRGPPWGGAGRGRVGWDGVRGGGMLPMGSAAAPADGLLGPSAVSVAPAVALCLSIDVVFP
jgi:hypothetical protein